MVTRWAEGGRLQVRQSRGSRVVSPFLPPPLDASSGASPWVSPSRPSETKPAEKRKSTAAPDSRQSTNILHAVRRQTASVQNSFFQSHSTDARPQRADRAYGRAGAVSNLLARSASARRLLEASLRHLVRRSYTSDPRVSRRLMDRPHVNFPSPFAPGQEAQLKVFERESA